MENIIESIKCVMGVSAHQKAIEKFAIQKYNEKFPDRPKYGYHYYTGFTILSETKIQIEYDYGAGEYEYDGSFTVDLVPEVRDNKINEIIK